MSEEEEVYEKHSPDICVSDVSHKFLTHFGADLQGYFEQAFSNSRCWGSAIQAGFGPTMYCHFDRLRLSCAPQRERELRDNFIHC